MTVHVPILLRPIVDALIEPLRGISEPHWVVDCTLGGGGHTGALLEALRPTPHRLLSLDRDQGAVDRARTRFATEIQSGRLELAHTPFGDATDLVAGRPTLGLMADLGFSSDQLEDGERGLSFMRPGPLDMRLDPTSGSSCFELLQRVPESELADVIFQFGEERLSRRIAAAIVHARQAGQLPSTTQGLAELVTRAHPPAARHGRIHAATRTFQALRIWVNDELEELDRLLERVILGVKPGGRVAIMSFHSLEDRKVKQLFKARDGIWEPLSKKPIEADEAEVAANPRSRSAKLRIAERKA